VIVADDPAPKVPTCHVHPADGVDVLVIAVGVGEAGTTEVPCGTDNETTTLLAASGAWFRTVIEMVAVSPTVSGSGPTASDRTRLGSRGSVTVGGCSDTTSGLLACVCARADTAGIDADVGRNEPSRRASSRWWTMRASIQPPSRHSSAGSLQAITYHTPKPGVLQSIDRSSSGSVVEQPQRSRESNRCLFMEMPEYSPIRVPKMGDTNRTQE
jgi:hypothetical protein